MSKSKTPWVVLDSIKQEMRCNRCKDSRPMSCINGALIDVAIGFLNAFIKVHKKCKEPIDKNVSTE